MATWDWLKPVLLAGGAIGGGLLANRKSSEEKAALTSASELNKMLADIAGQQWGAIYPGLQDVMNYYRTLLGMSPVSAGVSGTGSIGSVLQGTGQVPFASLAGKPGGTAGTMLGRGLTGATIGSMVFPGIGTAIGAGIGALTGLVGRGRKEANKLVPAQNQLTSNIGAIAQEVERRQQAGTLTAADLQEAYNLVKKMQGEFNDVAGQFGRAGPGGVKTISSWVDPMLESWASQISAMPPAPAGAEGTAAGGPLTGANAQRIATERVLSLPIQATTAQYETAKKNILSTLPPGGVRDKMLAELDADRVRDVGNLFTTVQPMAAAGLANLVTGNASSALQGLYGAGNQSMSLADLLAGNRSSTVNTGLGIGNLLGQILYGQKKSDSGGKAADNMPLMAAFGF